MAKLFPFRPSEEPEVESEPRLVGIDDEAADEVFAALSSETARTILSALYEEPTTASEVADQADTSLQNARYHLDKLQEAGLVREVDTWYSSRGTEMTVYGPTSEPLVVAAGEEESRSVLRRALKRVVGAVGILGVASLAIDRLVRRLGTGLTGAGGAPSDFSVASGEDPGLVQEGGLSTATPSDAAADTATPAPEATRTPVEVARDTPTAVPAGTPTPPETVAPAATGTPDVDEATVATTASEDGGLRAAEATPAPTTERAVETRHVVRETAEIAGGGFDPGALPPGAVFFAGGLLAVALIAGWWYWTRYRPLYRE